MGVNALLVRGLSGIKDWERAWGGTGRALSRLPCRKGEKDTTMLKEKGEGGEASRGIEWKHTHPRRSRARSLRRCQGGWPRRGKVRRRWEMCVSVRSFRGCKAADERV